MNKIRFIVLLFVMLVNHYAMSQQKNSAKEVVSMFLQDVRSGRQPQKAFLYMADTVLAYQLNAEDPVTVIRTPENYTLHIQSFLEMFGDFEFTVTELIAEGDKVYARWIQKGKQQTEIDGYKATGKPLTEITSVVYRVSNGKIVEYWLQTDRYGFEQQLKANAGQQ